MSRRAIHSIILLLAVGAAGCSSRTAAATQQTVLLFDATQSDAKAIEIVDQMVANLGGAAAWAAVKQIRWEQKYELDGELKGEFRHSWDLWNGRHRYEYGHMPSLAEAKLKGDPSLYYFTIAMYDLFDHEGKGTVVQSNRQLDKAPAADRDRFVRDAYTAWKRDAYQLTMLFKLRDPGVKLNYTGDIKDVQGLCVPGCHEIKVTFAPEIGNDTYYVSINTQSKLPEIVQKTVEGGRLGFKLSDWITANGLKFPGKHQNLGMAGEVFSFSNVRIGNPDDSLYIPRVQ